MNKNLDIIDILLSEIQKRKAAYTNVYERFGVLTEISLPDSDIPSKCKQLTRYYNNDIEPDFEKEFRLFTKYGDFKTGAEMVIFLHENKLITSFPNVTLKLRRRAIFLGTETYQRLPAFHDGSIALVRTVTFSHRVGNSQLITLLARLPSRKYAR